MSDSSVCLFCLNRKSQVVILGEIGKWVPLSTQRVRNVSYGSDVTLTLKGSTNEEVTMFFMVDEHVTSITCMIGASGVARLYLNAKLCKSF